MASRRINKRYAERLKKLFEHFSIHDGYLKRFCGVSASAINRWRSGYSKPRYLDPIAASIGCTEGELRAYLENGEDTLSGFFDNASEANMFDYDKMVILSALYLRISVFEVESSHIAQLAGEEAQVVEAWRGKQVPPVCFERFCDSVGVNYIRLINTPLWKCELLGKRTFSRQRLLRSA